MKPPLLCFCGVGYWPKQAWLHVKCATNTASNTATNTESNATNAKPDGAVPEVGVSEPRPVGIGVLEGSVQAIPKSANRRSKEAYNAYQREYMRKRRADLRIAKGIA